jgi:hypothetical protein
MAAAKVGALLSRALQPLASHARPAVRLALAQAAMQLLERCDLALQQCTRPLLELLLTLAQDEWPQVAAACAEWLAAGGSVASIGAGSSTGEAAATASGAGARAPAQAVSINAQPQQQAQQQPQQGLWPKLDPILQDLLSALFKAVRAGDSAGAMHARRLSTAVLVAGHEAICRQVLQRPALLGQLLQNLLQSFAFERSGASLLLHTRPEGGAYEAPAAGAGAWPAAAAGPGSGSGQQLREQQEGQQGDLFRLLQQQEERQRAAPPLVRAVVEEEGPPLQPPAGPSSSTGAAGAAGTAGAPGPAAAGALVPAAPQYPRMPMNLAYIASARSYAAVAGVARALGHTARLADLSAGQSTGRSNLRRVVDQLTSELGSRLQAGSGGEGQQQQQQLVVLGGSAGSGSWPLEAAAAITVLSEVLFGASAAWRSPLAVAGPAPDKPAAGDADFEQVCVMAAEALASPALWGLPTQQAAAGQEQQQQQQQQQEQEQQSLPLSAQALGEHALVLRVLLEGVGALARAMGRRFADNGRVLRPLLMPLLERLGDPCAFVASAASGAAAAVCLSRCCGCASPSCMPLPLPAVACNASCCVAQPRHG